MIIFNIFAISSGLMIGWMAYEFFVFFKPIIYKICLNCIEHLEANYNLSIKSKISGFDLGYSKDTLKVHKKNEVQNEIKRIKKKNEPVKIEVLKSVRSWDVITNIQTLEYTTIETTNELATLD